MNCLLLGDVRERLRELPDTFVDAVITDPPYELGFMGKRWDATGIANDVGMWCEVLRVLKPGGHLLAFGGTRTYHRMVCAIEDAGFEIRDSIHWIYGTGFPKSLNIGDGRGTALKPGHEPIVLARRPVDGTIADNVARWGSGALNIDACRLPISQEDAVYIADRIGGFNNTRSIGGNGAYQGGEILDRTTYDASKGRWPANVVFDEDAAAELDAQTGERTSGKPVGTKSGGQGNAYGRYGGGIPVTGYGDTGGVSRFFYCAKASRSERERGCESLPLKTAGEATGGRADGSDGLNSPRAGAGRTSGARNFHPTVKPVSLMRWLVRLVTPPSGIVLDPFMGSGTTGIAAQMEGVEFIGIEIDPDYFRIAEARLAEAEAGVA